MDTAFEAGIGIYLLLAIVFSSWVLPRNLTSYRLGPTLYLMLNTLFWFGNLFVFAFLGRGLPEEYEVQPFATIGYGILCFHIGIYLQFTPREMRTGKRRDS